MAHDVDHAAELQAGRIFLAAEAHRDRDAHARAGLQPQEVDVDRPVGHRIDLDRARQNARLLAADVEHHQRLEQGALVVDLAKGALIHLNVLRLAFPAIHDAGNLALEAGLIGGTFAPCGPRLGGEVDHLTHGGIP